MPSTRQQGFTLIELLLVILIIATLATIVLVALDSSTRPTTTYNSHHISSCTA